MTQIQFYQDQVFVGGNIEGRGEKLRRKSQRLESKLQNFYPIDKNHIKFYSCGPTIYDDIHIGNARPIVVFDVLFRLLLSIYKKVTYVRNITDIDDKIIVRAKENQESFTSLTKRTETAFIEVTNKLYCLPPTFQPKASEHISNIIKMIEILLSKGYAYRVSGDVYFEVEKWSKYGEFAKKNLSELQAGARVEASDIKRNPLDFAIWKECLDSSEPSWPSPFGSGRPGWHIECSAMTLDLLGETFDIHTGGQDLIFPHHQNEVAQSCCVTGRDKLANYWLHNGYVTLDDRKMSKSENHMVLVRDLLEKYNGEVIRLVLLQTHYRSPLNFSQSSIDQSLNFLENIYKIIRPLYENITKEKQLLDNVKPEDEFIEILAKDLNIPKALTYLSSKIKEIQKTEFPKSKNSQLIKLIANFKVLGLLNFQQDSWRGLVVKNSAKKISEQEIEKLIKQRNQFRLEKKYEMSDTIRQELKAKGVILEDESGITKWYRS